MPQTQRNLEFWLLLLAFVINAAAIVLVQLGALGRDRHDLLVLLGAGLSVLVFALHIALRFVARDADPFVLPIATVLTGLGIADDLPHRHRRTARPAGSRPPCARSRGARSRSSARSPRSSSSAQLPRAVPLHLPRRARWRSCCSCCPSSRASAREASGADVWICSAFFSTFQPGEIAKIALAIFFAGYLVRNRDSLHGGPEVPRHDVAACARPRAAARDLALSISVIVLQRDLGTALLYLRDVRRDALRRDRARRAGC